jgi:ABC-type multidrug transport system permease subunit
LAFRVAESSPILNEMVAAIVWLLISLGMVAWNRWLARAIVASNRALADRLGVEWVRRWFFWPYYRSWAVAYTRAGLILMGLLWTAAAAVVVGLKAS